MKTSFLLVGLVAAGCAGPKDVTQAKLQFQHGTNLVTITQPKDTVIDGLEFDPVTGKIRLTGYRSTANEGAIEASKLQLQSQWATMQQFFTFLQMVGVAAGKSQGVDLSGAIPTNRPAQQIVVPDGYKLVPRDDPSVPRQWMFPDPGYIIPNPSIPFGVLTNPPITIYTNVTTTSASALLFNTIEATNRFLGTNEFTK